MIIAAIGAILLTWFIVAKGPTSIKFFNMVVSPALVLLMVVMLYLILSHHSIGELCDDNQQLTRSLRATHEVCDQHNDVATASLIEVWIDESERRTWFLAEIAQDA